LTPPTSMKLSNILFVISAVVKAPANTIAFSNELVVAHESNEALPVLNLRGLKHNANVIDVEKDASDSDAADDGDDGEEDQVEETPVEDSVEADEAIEADDSKKKKKQSE
jgi:hypothetical protein